MDAYEYGIWIIRMIVLVMVSAILVILLSLTIPKIHANDIRADVLSARVVHNGGFSPGPGVVDKQLFLSVDPDARVLAPQDIILPVTAEVTVRSAQGDLLVDRVLIYNRPAHAKLDPLRRNNVRSVHVQERVLPVLLQDGDTAVPAYLHVEAFYEN